MMKRLMLKTIIIFYLFTKPMFYAYASQELNNIDLTPIETVIGQSDTAFQVDVLGLFAKALAGELDLSPQNMIMGLLKILFAEVFENVGLLRNLLLLAILSAIIKNLSESFQNKSVSEIGFYISYIAMVAVMFSSLSLAASILTDFIGKITSFMNAGVPIFISLVAMSGNFTGAYVFNTLMLFAASFVDRLFVYIIIPALISAGVLNIVNYISETDVLTNLATMLKKGISWLVKIIATGFVSILSIQKISTPLANTIALKTAKTAVNAIPVVGNILTGAVENVMYWAKAMGGGVLIVVTISMVSICIIPLVKLSALSITYKLAAALIQPICDKRIVECLDAASSYTALMLSSAALISLMFVISVIIMLSF